MQRADDIEVKLGRIDISNFDKFQLFVFRRGSPIGVRTVSHLPSRPKEMSKISQLMYKWVLPNGNSLRKLLENLQGSAVDFTSDPTERNFLMYESAEPLVRLYNPLFEMDDTFVLQEYFVPPSSFKSWINNVQLVLTADYTLVKLLNCTIRYVKRDDTTALAYSNSDPEGSFAFVLYFRLKRSVEADNELKTIHNTLVEITLKLNGTFYLPYRHHYTMEQVKKSYPMVENFFQTKVKHDPYHLFETAWSSLYGSTYMDYSIDLVTSDVTFPSLTLYNESKLSSNPGYAQGVPIVEEFRFDSYNKLLRDPDMRNKCFTDFLYNVLNIEDPKNVKAIVCAAYSDINNKNDLDIYSYIIDKLRTDAAGPTAQLNKMWKSDKQLHAQRKEITRELAAILSRIGMFGKIKDYVSIGDNGKFVLTFEKSIPYNNGMEKNCGSDTSWI